jgi:hypothetical protein
MNINPEDCKPAIYFVQNKCLPTRISEDKFVKYHVEHPYFVLSDSQHDYFLFTEADSNRCSMNSIVICPADVAIYNRQSITCASSLYFQATTDHNVCRRDLLLHFRTPTLQRHGATWVYHFPEPQQISLRCKNHSSWTSHTEIISGASLITNATMCSISTDEIHFQNCTSHLMLLLTPLTFTYLLKSPSSPIARKRF